MNIEAKEYKVISDIHSHRTPRFYVIDPNSGKLLHTYFRTLNAAMRFVTEQITPGYDVQINIEG